MNKNKYVYIDGRRRRLLIAGAAWPALAWTRAARTQTKPPILIGWLHQDSRETSAGYLAAFKEGLAALGWKEGLQFVIEERWADGRQPRLQLLAGEVALKQPAIIVAAPNPSTSAAAKAAPQVPIVQASGGDPVEAGLVKSLARPGGMITGLSNLSGSLIREKYVELLLAAAPKVRRVGVLGLAYVSGAGGIVPAATTGSVAVGRSAAQLSVDAQFVNVAGREDIEPAIARLAKAGVQALVVLQYSLLRVERQLIMKLAQAQRWPVVSGVVEFAEAGALISYGADVLANYRRAAYYVDRILKGAKPADLPIEQPTKFECIVNLKSAKALGLTIPPSVMVQATRVIE
jgi:putative ABC transport system substrate-binding protein